MFCGRCGTQIDDDALFCPSCGAKMSPAEPVDDMKTEYADFNGAQNGYSDRYNNYNNQGYQNQGYQQQGYQNQGYQNQGYQQQGQHNQGYDEFGGPGPDLTDGGKKSPIALIIGLIIAIIAIIAVLIGVFFVMKKSNAPDPEDLTDYYVTGLSDDTMDIEDEEGEVILSVSNFDVVQVVEDEDNTDDSWKVYVEAEDAYGHFDPHYLTEEEDNATSPYNLYVKEKDVPLYAEKDDKDGSYWTLQKGESVKIIAEYDDVRYVYAEETDKFGYVDYEKLTDVFFYCGYGDEPEEDTDTYYVTFDRKQQLPMVDDEGNPIAGLDFGDKVYVINTDADMWYSYANGVYGFVDPAGLSTKKPQVKTYETYYVNYQKVTANGSYLALRSKSDLNNTIAKLYNEEVQVQLDENGDIIKTKSSSVHSYEGQVEYWYIYVPSKNQYGYVNSLYLKQ